VITGRLPSDTVHSRVAQLRDLRSGLEALPEVIALGDTAVAALEALLRGPSESIPHRRWLAADALGAIGSVAAIAALVRALRDCSARDLPPVLLEAEDLIVNRIAEHLGTGRESNATDALLEALSRRAYPNCARALGKRAEPRAIPLLVRCLHEDTARAAAVEALQPFQQAAIEPLIRGLNDVPNGPEAPSHIDGRAAAAALLGGLAGLAAKRALLHALSDNQDPVRLAAALALAGHRGLAGRQAAAVLVMALADVDWALADTITHALARLGPLAERAVLAAIAQEPRRTRDSIRRMRAVGVVARLGIGSAASILAGLRDAPDGSLRLAAIGALSSYRTVDSAVLSRFLSDPLSLVRRQALKALCARDSIAPAEAVELLGDPDARVRSLAERRLQHFGTMAAPVLRRAVLRCGAPLHGWARWRLWCRACRLWGKTLIASVRAASHGNPPRRSLPTP
jgi:HEAT repeat protein